MSSLILPVATLALVTIASFSRYMRSSTLENMVQDYVRTARAKGASNSRVLFVHVLRNAMIPILTLIGLSVGYVFSGALITEALFNYPGMGYIFWNAALTQDYPIILGVIVVTGFATVLGSLMADIMYAIADPRVRYRRAMTRHTGPDPLAQASQSRWHPVPQENTRGGPGRRAGL